jgi:ABC-type nitrate/sulfonate/bicarbonate transport system substrate-binding protein
MPTSGPRGGIRFVGTLPRIGGKSLFPKALFVGKLAMERQRERTIMRNRNHLAAAVLAAALAASGPAAAQESAVLAFPNTSMSFTMSYVALDLGLWAKQGLKVKDIFVAGPGALNAVIAGSADFSLSSALTLTRAAIRGQRMLAIANTMGQPQTEVVVRKDVADAAGYDPKAPIAVRGKILKGRTWAISGVNTPEQMLLRVIASRAGLNPDTDFKTSILQAASVIPALKSKAVDGFSNSMPWPLEVIHDGSAVLVGSSLRGDFPEFNPMGQVLLVTRPQVCKDKPTLCRKMAAGILEASDIMYKQPERAIAVLAKRFPQVNPDVLKQAYGLIRDSTTNPPKLGAVDFEHAERYNIAAGLEKPADKLASYSGLFTDEFTK